MYTIQNLYVSFKKNRIFYLKVNTALYNNCRRHINYDSDNFIIKITSVYKDQTSTIGPKSKMSKNLTASFFKTLNDYLHFFGVSNLWTEKLDRSGSSVNRRVSKVITLCLYIFVISETIGFFTQPNLTEKQSSDRLLLGISHPILINYYTSVEYHKEKLKKIIHALSVALKNVYNDQKVERGMIRKSKLYSAAYLFSFSSALISYGIDALIQVFMKDGTFTTVITAWPDVEDRSSYANIARIISYFLWWIFMTRMSAIYVLVICLTICLSHQYKNLQSYFYHLVEIFDDQDLSQEEKEQKYEESVKIGIKLHSDTLWCTRESETACAVVFSGQILVNISVLCLLMLQMVNSERTLSNALATITTGVTMLISTGFFMWSAGDVTVEASHLGTAMYSSGWENCRNDCSIRIRRLLVIAMAQSQRPVTLRSFGIIELSYQSYVSIVKSSYSVFSILY
nr:odorant receptor 1 [Papilio dardanus]